MRIYKTKNYDEMSKKAAQIIAAQIELKPECVLGLATGSTPVGTYQNLVKWYQEGSLDFSGVSLDLALDAPSLHHLKLAMNAPVSYNGKKVNLGLSSRLRIRLIG